MLARIDLDVAQDVAEDVLGAAENGGVEVFIFPIAIFQRRNPSPTHEFRPPRLPFGCTLRTDAAQEVANM